MKKYRKKILISLISVFVIMCPLYACVINALEEGGILTTPEEERAQKIFREIRCLACDGQSVKDSEAEFAKSVRAIVRQKIKEGYEDKKILEFLRENYSDGIFFEPPLNLSTFLLWILPFAMIISGFMAFVLYLRKQKYS